MGMGPARAERAVLTGRACSGKLFYTPSILRNESASLVLAAGGYLIRDRGGKLTRSDAHAQTHTHTHTHTHTTREDLSTLSKHSPSPKGEGSETESEEDREGEKEQTRELEPERG